MSHIDNQKTNFRNYFDSDSSAEEKFSPALKIAILFIYVCTAVSFGKYDLMATAIFAALPLFALLAAAKNIFKALRTALAGIAIAILIGAANVWFDRTPMYDCGFLKITGGWISLFVLCVKAWECVLAAATFAQCTSPTQMACGLACFKIPSPIALQLSLTMRYIPIITNEARTILDAYVLRSARLARAARISEWPTLAGSLMLRSFDRASNLYRAMCARGFEAKNICRGRQQKVSRRDIALAFSFACACALYRFLCG